MKSILIFLCVTATVVNFINADVYLHSPRGSNNRLNEKSANRKNANRVFDSQVCIQNAPILVHFKLYILCVDLERVLFRSILLYAKLINRILSV
jgi:hypothetical protein